MGKYSPVSKITREQDAAKARELETWLCRLIDSYSVLSVDAAAFRQWGKLMHRKSDTLTQDAMIAAVAVVHGLTVVTRNVRDFEALGIVGPIRSEAVHNSFFTPQSVAQPYR